MGIQEELVIVDRETAQEIVSCCDDYIADTSRLITSLRKVDGIREMMESDGGMIQSMIHNMKILEGMSNILRDRM